MAMSNIIDKYLSNPPTSIEDELPAWREVMDELLKMSDDELTLLRNKLRGESDQKNGSKT